VGPPRLIIVPLNLIIMNVDVEIYLNGVIKFFKSNPKDLFTLIPEGKELDFYDKIREVSLINLDKGDDVSLTQKQILEICLILNGKDPNTPKIKPADNYIFETKFGTIFLN
jgi:hypothetical protein